MHRGRRRSPDGGSAPARRSCHEGWLYRTPDELVERAAAFVLEGVEAGEAVFAVLPGSRLEPLRDALGAAAAEVQWADMEDVGRNPGRLIGLWQGFIDRFGAGGRPLRGLGEPAYAGRDADELVECLHHEALLDVALGDDVPLSLVCPYDLTGLPPEAVDGAHATHPVLQDTDERVPSARFLGERLARGILHHELPEPPVDPVEIEFDAGTLGDVREFTRRYADRCRISSDRATDLVVAINELTSNSVRHGGGSGVLRSWCDGEVTVHEVRDHGRVDDPLLGRMPPPVDRQGGRGLWMVHHLCDLVQLRSGDRGTTVRVRMAR
jgi:anti-sigma regulatory factor (Ser/Thr protein kinase)